MKMTKLVSFLSICFIWFFLLVGGVKADIVSVPKCSPVSNRVTIGELQIVFDSEKGEFCCGAMAAWGVPRCENQSKPICESGASFISSVGKCLLKESSPENPKISLPSCSSGTFRFDVLGKKFYCKKDVALSCFSRIDNCSDPVCLNSGPHTSYSRDSGLCITKSLAQQEREKREQEKRPASVVNWINFSPSRWLTSFLEILGFGGYRSNFFENVIHFVINLLIFLIVALSLIFIIVGGIMWMVSSGNKEGLAKARSTVAYALIGLIIGLFSFIIVNFLFQLFGVVEVPATVKPGSCDECVTSCMNERGENKENCVNIYCKGVCSSPIIITPSEPVLY